MTHHDKLRLKPIDPVGDSNLVDACRTLEVHPHQRDFVDNPVVSLKEGLKYPNAVPVAIMLERDDGESIPVGLIFYEWLNSDKTEFLIWDFMIDKHYQKRGLGKQAMVMIMEHLQNQFQFRRLEIAFVKENIVVRNLYAALGFTETGQINDDGELIMELVRG